MYIVCMYLFTRTSHWALPVLHDHLLLTPPPPPPSAFDGVVKPSVYVCCVFALCLGPSCLSSQEGGDGGGQLATCMQLSLSQGVTSRYISPRVEASRPAPKRCSRGGREQDGKKSMIDYRAHTMVRYGYSVSISNFDGHPESRC